ncbi:MAG: cupredoxin domain-containing protein, partial [Actinomycetota bacterium]|nr:cupredoxin domain-containing protein [Actinomycetota bacterium]
PTTAAGAVPAQSAACPPEAADPGAPLIVNFLYCPATVTVAVGTELGWTNRDQALHTVTADSGGFDTGNFGRGEVRTIRFDRPGTFPYFCRLHPFMRGTVVVA